MKKRAMGIATLCVCVASMIGCSKKTDVTDSSTSSTKSGAAGKPASSGAAGKTASTSMGGSSTPQQTDPFSAPCGSTTCVDMFMVGMVCCVDASKGLCG